MRVSKPGAAVFPVTLLSNLASLAFKGELATVICLYFIHKPRGPPSRVRGIYCVELCCVTAQLRIGLTLTELERFFEAPDQTSDLRQSIPGPA